MPELTSNILLATNNVLTQDSQFHAAESGSFDPSFPGTNSIDGLMYTFARWTGFPTSSKFVAYDLGYLAPIQIVSIIKHNFSFDGTWKVEISSTSDFSVIDYDSGFVSMFPAVIPYSSSLWAGTIDSRAFLAQYTKIIAHVLPDIVKGRYVRITISDPSNPNDYLHFAKAWIGGIYQPSINVNYGAEIIPIDDTAMFRSRSGVKHFSPLKARRRAMRIPLEGIPVKELYENILGPFYMLNGNSTECIVIMNPTDFDLSWPYEMIYGTVGEQSPVRHSFWNRADNSLFIDESL